MFFLQIYKKIDIMYWLFAKDFKNKLCIKSALCTGAMDGRFRPDSELGQSECSPLGRERGHTRSADFVHPHRSGATGG
jgi:hypothetical protein